MEGAVLGGYQLDEVIGRGATSEVWRARRAGRPAPPVALKRGPGLQAEAAALRALDHPNVLRLVETVPDGEGVALALALAEGGSLEDRLIRRGRLEPRWVVAALAPIADALAHAHRAGVVHGDVKPANVLFTGAGVPVLADFGAATGTDLAGSAAFVDPHVVELGRADASGDVHALAVVAYLCLTGRLPHTGAGDEAIVDAARRGDHRSLLAEPNVPGALASVVEAALSTDRDRRPDAARFGAALRAAVRPGVVTRTFGPRPAASRVPVGTGAPRLRHRRHAAVALVAAGLLAVGAGGALLAVHRGGPAPCAPVAAGALQADLAGDGCPVAVSWDGNVMQFRLQPGAPLRRYGFASDGAASRGGALLLGDWDCDGRDSPAYYDPDDGRVHYFSLVPETGALAAARLDDTGVAAGHARVVRGRDGCDRVAVRT